MWGLLLGLVVSMKGRFRGLWESWIFGMRVCVYLDDLGL